MIGAMITMYGAVASRQREIGTLRALGFSRSSVLSSFLFEAVLLSVVGGAVGAAASMLMGFVHFSMVNMASWSEMVFSFDPTPSRADDGPGLRLRDGSLRRPPPGRPRRADFAPQGHPRVKRKNRKIGTIRNSSIRVF